ncbi:hypothetical protein ACH5RR_028128 [Cinchona calisaya]|uniref:EF-hand domain-containing protein n=1 Tax=Cinchona calisaya TaxID=153742 RepID=A0ABD2YSC1_9GENT
MTSMAKTTRSLLSFLLLLLTTKIAAGRPFLSGQNHLELVSDGVDDYPKKGSSKSFIVFKGIDSSEEGLCEQLYGFLPCSNNLAGHLFLIAVYEYLLFRGESLVASGGERIFKILGPGVFGASAFHLLGSLPEALILLASGLLNSREIAQEYVLTGVGLLAGSTILLLTVIWGTCVLFGSQEFPNDEGRNPSATSDHIRNQFKRLLSLSKGYGLITDAETSYTAIIMVLSVIPFIVIQVPRIFRLSSSSEQIVIIISLLISVTFLLIYFSYQIFQPWIQKRRLDYIRHDHLVVDILAHVQNHTIGRLLTKKGAPNVPAIRRLFQETDQDGDNFISVSELKEFLKECRFRKVGMNKDEAIAEMLGIFDLDKDGKINSDEFVNGITKWIDEAKRALEKQFHSKNSLKRLYEVLKTWIQEERTEDEIMKHLVPEILKHFESFPSGALLAEDGTPDRTAIRSLFDEIDRNKDNLISLSELQELLADVKFGRATSISVNEAAALIMEQFDISLDGLLDEDEFVGGLSNWLHKTTNVSTTNLVQNEDHSYQEIWKQMDLVLEPEAEKSIRRALLAWTKAVLRLLLGIAMLGVLAEPLIESVQNFSKSANMPSFFISFILVPLATNARIAISAIKEARKKAEITTSLTFSEIYGGVFVNNLLGFSVLLAIVYFRGLSWTFSTEVLMVLIVTSLVGCLPSINSKIPLWASFVAYLLYPLSLILVYLLHA